MIEIENPGLWEVECEQILKQVNPGRQFVLRLPVPGVGLRPCVEWISTESWNSDYSATSESVVTAREKKITKNKLAYSNVASSSPEISSSVTERALSRDRNILPTIRWSGPASGAMTIRTSPAPAHQLIAHRRDSDILGATVCKWDDGNE